MIGPFFPNPMNKLVRYLMKVKIIAPFLGLIILAMICASCGLKALPEIPSAEPDLDAYLQQLRPTNPPTPGPSDSSLISSANQKNHQ